MVQPQARGLVEAAARGDREAFANLARSAADGLLATALWVVDDRELAEDAVRRTLVAAWRDLPGLADPTQFEQWLHRRLVRTWAPDGRAATAAGSEASHVASLWPETLEATISDVERTRQVPARRGLRAVTSTASGRVALAAGVLVAVMVAGGIGVRVLAPAPVRTVSPGGPDALAAGGRTYVSMVFGYRLEVPAGWTVRDPLAHPSFVDAAGELRAIVMTSNFDWDRRDWPWGHAVVPYSVTGTTLDELMDQVRASARSSGVKIVADDAFVIDGLPARRVRATLPADRADTTTVFLIRGRWQQAIMWFGPPADGKGASVDDLLDSFEVTHEIGVPPRRPG